VSEQRKIRVAVVFGGRGPEHAVSCMGGGNMLASIDRDRYDVVPIGITRDGNWLQVADEPARLAITGGELPSVESVAEPGSQVVPWAQQGAVLASAPGQIPHLLSEVDVVLPVLHGPFGEDGTIQGLLEMAGVPYVGAGVLASAVSMDKEYMKIIFQARGLPVGPYVVVRGPDWDPAPPQNAQASSLASASAGSPFRAYVADSPSRGADSPSRGTDSPSPGADPPFPGADPPSPGADPPFPGADPPFPGADSPFPERKRVLDKIAELGWPLFVKPARGGSSIGTSKARDMAQLEQAIQLARQYDPKVIVEAAIEGREIEVSVLEGRRGGPPDTSLPGQLLIDGGEEFWDFEAKYLDQASGMAIPAPIPAEHRAEIRALAATAFDAVSCEGLARVDFFYTPEGKILVNEINTIPGLSPASYFQKMWEASGLPFPQLIDRLLQTALSKGRGLR
jgi:D-alanine-D-alanine ligase-like ATP-grasp enzyme